MMVKVSRMVCQDHVPRINDLMFSSASLVRRQRDGLATGLGGPASGVVGCTGGRFRDLPGILFCNQEDDELGEDPGLREFRFLGLQLVKASQTFHALEGQFDLPAKAVNREHVGEWEGVSRQGSQKQDVMCSLKASRVDLLAFSAGLFDQALFFSLRFLVALAPDD